MSEENNGTPNDPRPIKDMKGLLRFCMEATRSEDAPGSTSGEILVPMTEDRKKWLEEALTSMTVNPVERMTLCVKAIEQAEVDTEVGTEQQIRAVTELQDWAEDMDIAGDFIKINGLRIVPKLLTSEVSELRWRCLELLGNLSQNNPIAQTALLTLKLVPAILMLLNTDAHPNVRVKALYAISCLVRSNVEAQQQLLAHDGLSALVKALHSEEEKMRVKATFLISAICGANPAFKDTIVEKGAIEQLVQLLKEEEHGTTHEHILSALLAIVSDHEAARRKCLKEDLDVKSFLCKRIKFLEGKEAFQEEREYAERLLEVLNKPSGGCSTSSSTSNHNMAVMAV